MYNNYNLNCYFIIQNNNKFKCLFLTYVLLTIIKFMFLKLYLS